MKKNTDNLEISSSPSKVGEADSRASDISRPITYQEALDAIEAISGDDFCEEMSMETGSGRDAEWSPELKTALDKLSTIYRIAHSVVKSHSCFSVHGDWRREAAAIYRTICTSDTATTQCPTESPDPLGDSKVKKGDQE